MGVSLIIDDTTLALLVVLIGALALNIYTARASTPLLHPLLLARQAEVATVRQPSESAVYRNSNSPTGFDLAAKPRREIVDVRSLIDLGVTGSEKDVSRNVLGYKAPLSNRQILDHCAALAHAVAGTQEQITTLFIAGASEEPSYALLVGLLAATARSSSPLGSIQTIVLPSTDSPAFSSALQSFPDAVTSKASSGSFAILAGPNQLDKLQQAPEGNALLTLLGLTSTSASAPAPIVIIDDTLPSFSAAQSTTSGLPLARTITFSQLLAASTSSAPTAADSDNPLQRAAKLVAWFPAVAQEVSQGIHWVPASNAVLVAGVTAQLSLFPADKIPNRTDEVLVATDGSEQQSLTLAHPAGLSLALTTLYTASSLRIQSLQSLRSETNETNASSKVTLVVLPSSVAPTLTNDLTKSSLSNQSHWASSPLFGPYLRRAALRTLRYGSIPAPRRPAPPATPAVPLPSGASKNGNDSGSGLATVQPSYSATAALALAHVRSLLLITSEPSHAPDQTTLDTLRLEFGCPAWQVYLPLHALSVRQNSDNVETDREVGDWALVAGPVTAAHSLDFQAFASFESVGSGKKPRDVKGTHAGAPSVSLEVKLVDVSEAATDGRTGDLEGAIELRGKTVALYTTVPPPPAQPSASAAGAGAAAGPPRPPAAPPSGFWVRSAHRGSWRSNGTLVLLP